MTGKACLQVRKLIILVLTLGAVAAGSYEIVTRRWSVNPSDPTMGLPRGHALVFNLDPGFIGVTHYRPYEGVRFAEERPIALGPIELLRFQRWYRGQMHRGVSFRVAAWLACLVLGFYPVIVLWQGPLRRVRRRLFGGCLTCGYNLKGNVSGVCPECGTEVERT